VAFWAGAAIVTAVLRGPTLLQGVRSAHAFVRRPAQTPFLLKVDLRLPVAGYRTAMLHERPERAVSVRQRSMREERSSRALSRSWLSEGYRQRNYAAVEDRDLGRFVSQVRGISRVTIGSRRAQFSGRQHFSDGLDKTWPATQAACQIFFHRRNSWSGWRVLATDVCFSRNIMREDRPSTTSRSRAVLLPRFGSELRRMQPRLPVRAEVPRGSTGRRWNH
jgi:hypothetical protein